MRRSLCLLAALALTGTLCACAVTTERSAEPAYISPYNWDNLEYQDGRYFYYKNDVPASRIGIDVSEHQREIDWHAVAGDGIEFAFIRLGNRGYTEGDIYLDKRFEVNITGAREAGIARGVYFFSQAIDEEEAREEAAFVVEALAGRSLEYPVVFDHEPVVDAAGRANNLSSDQLTRNARAFCEALEQAGYDAMIYGNTQDIGRLDLSALSPYDIWFAEYDVAIPGGQFDFIVWQYANNGEVAGIPTRVDMNIHFLKP